MNKCPECGSEIITLGVNMRCTQCDWYGIRQGAAKRKKKGKLLTSGKKKTWKFKVILNNQKYGTTRTCIPKNEVFKVGDEVCYIQEGDEIRVVHAEKVDPKEYEE